MFFCGEWHVSLMPNAGVSTHLPTTVIAREHRQLVVVIINIRYAQSGIVQAKSNVNFAGPSNV
jgi:predicted fused transcriptional regulator/phosphomethylpyrimidine kinase